jgi:hypothetical protein
LDSLRAQYKPIYPFTIYHSADKLIRRYTLYAPTESAREKWRNAFIEAKGIDDVRRDANKVCTSVSTCRYAFIQLISGLHRNSLMMALSDHQELTLSAALDLKRQGGSSTPYLLVRDILPPSPYNIADD